VALWRSGSKESMRRGTWDANLLYNIANLLAEIISDNVFADSWIREIR
jgi:hypothetical protein